MSSADLQVSNMIDPYSQKSSTAYEKSRREGTYVYSFGDG